MLRRWLFLMVACLETLAVMSSPFDPHLPAVALPALAFYNGWLVRLVDHAQNLSLACIVGSVKPEQSGAFNRSWAVLLYQVDAGSLHSEQHFLDQGEVEITPRSQASPRTASSFLWEASTRGAFNVSGDTAQLDFRFDKLHLQVRLSNRVPWDPREPNSAGPEGWAGRSMPIPLHHYVHSLASPAVYSLEHQDAEGGAVSGTGHAHMETMFGQVFPQAWVRSQGIGAGGTTQVLVSGGRYVSGPLSTDIVILAFRSPTLHWDMRSTDEAVFSRHVDVLAGLLNITARRAVDGRELRIRVRSEPGLFSEPLFSPTHEEGGFSKEPRWVQSHAATATVTAYLNGDFLESHTIPLATLEFGGDYTESMAELPAFSGRLR